MPYYQPPKPKRHYKRWLLVIVLLYVAWSAIRPLPALQPQFATTKLATQVAASNLNWPSAGEAAAGIVGTPILHTHGDQKAVPIASTAKILTALTVLQQKPLQLNKSGPTLTMTNADVALYNNYYSQQGSVVQVNAGEQLSEYQVLQAMMLPSANNLADSLAVWAFGSLSSYQTAAKAYLANHSLSTTTVGTDASGFSPTTTSTATDLVKLGELAMQNPVLAQIVDQSTATLPVAGQVTNVNSLLGSYGVIGVKTGNTDQAGGVFISASQVPINGKTQTVITATANAPSLYAALSESVPLLLSAQSDFTNVVVANKGSIVGHYQQPWGGTLNVTASQDLKVVAPRGGNVTGTVNLRSIRAKSDSGQIVGTAHLPATSFYSSRSVDLQLSGTPTKPSIWWRLLHP